MVKLNKTSINVAAVTLLLLLLTGLLLLPYHEQHPHRFTAEAGELACIDYDEGQNTIVINCNSSFSDVVQTVNDPEILANLGNGEYILNANLEIAEVSFAMTSNSDGLQYLKLAGKKG